MASTPSHHLNPKDGTKNAQHLYCSSVPPQHMLRINEDDQLKHFLIRTNQQEAAIKVLMTIGNGVKSLSNHDSEEVRASRADLGVCPSKVFSEL
jgi:hypothetical protein